MKNEFFEAFVEQISIFFRQYECKDKINFTFGGIL